MAGKTIDASMIGDRKALRRLERLRHMYPQAVAAALFEEALAIFAESQQQVPVDTGRLRASGLVAPSGVTRDFQTVIAYGTSYAVAVHERVQKGPRGPRQSKPGPRGPRKRRKKRAPGYSTGKPKYLEDPFRERAQGLLARVADRAHELARRPTPPKKPTPRRGRSGGK